MKKIEDENVEGIGDEICEVEIEGNYERDNGMKEIMVNVDLGDDDRSEMVVMKVRGGREDKECEEMLWKKGEFEEFEDLVIRGNEIIDEI